MVAAERQGSYGELSRLRLVMPPPSKKAVRWRGLAVMGDCARNSPRAAGGWERFIAAAKS